MAGVPVAFLARTLKAIERRKSFAANAPCTDTNFNCHTALAEEILVQAGLFDMRIAGVTALGRAFLKATRERLARTAALSLLRQLLEAADGYNRSMDRCDDIEQIWLFGSLATDSETVGDINLAIFHTPLAPPGHEEVQCHDTEERIRILPANPTSPASAQLQRLLGDGDLFGAPPDPAYNVLHNPDDLVAMATPCMLVFTRESGIVQAPTPLSKHPKAASRLATMPPELTRADSDQLLSWRPVLQPLRANWGCDARGVWGQSRRVYAPDPATIGFYNDGGLGRLESANRDAVVILSHDDWRYFADRGLPQPPETFDGRFRALIHASGIFLELQRTITVIDDVTLEYTLSLSNCHKYRIYANNVKNINYINQIIGHYLAAVVHADTLCTKAFSPKTELIHYYTNMAGFEVIQAEMRSWTEILIETNGLGS